MDAVLLGTCTLWWKSSGSKRSDLASLTSLNTYLQNSIQLTGLHVIAPHRLEIRFLGECASKLFSEPADLAMSRQPES